MFFICLAIFLFLAIKAASEKTLPSSYHGNWKLEQEDANKVRFGEMSRSEFLRNMDNGKYYAPPSPKTIDKNRVMFWCSLRSKNHLNLEADIGEYNFIKKLTPEEAGEMHRKLLSQKCKGEF